MEGPRMQDTAIFQALESKNSFITSLQNLLNSNKHVRVFLHWDKDLSQSEIAEKANVSTGTVSAAKTNLTELELLEDGEDGVKKTIKALRHPTVREAYLEALESE